MSGKIRGFIVRLIVRELIITEDGWMSVIIEYTKTIFKMIVNNIRHKKSNVERFPEMQRNKIFEEKSMSRDIGTDRCIDCVDVACG